MSFEKCQQAELTRSVSIIKLNRQQFVGYRHSRARRCHAPTTHAARSYRHRGSGAAPARCPRRRLDLQFRDDF